MSVENKIILKIKIQILLIFTILMCLNIYCIYHIVNDLGLCLVSFIILFIIVPIVNIPIYFYIKSSCRVYEFSDNSFCTYYKFFPFKLGFEEIDYNNIEEISVNHYPGISISLKIKERNKKLFIEYYLTNVKKAMYMMSKIIRDDQKSISYELYIKRLRIQDDKVKYEFQFIDIVLWVFVIILVRIVLFLIGVKI